MKIKEENLKLFNSSKEINSEIKIREIKHIGRKQKTKVIDNLIAKKWMK